MNNRTEFLSHWIMLFLVTTIIMYFVSPATFITTSSIIARLIITWVVTAISEALKN